MKIIEGKIVPGKGIDKYMLGCHEEDIIKYFHNDYFRTERNDGSCTIEVENAKFWFDSSKKLIQIGVTVGFNGVYDNKIGVGDTLRDINKKVGQFYEEDDDYLLKNIGGIAFTLSDIEDGEWDELSVPIEWIYVYKI